MQQLSNNQGEPTYTPPGVPLPSAFELFRPSRAAVMRNLNAFLLLVLVPAMYFLFVSLLNAREIASIETAKSHAAPITGLAAILWLIGLVYTFAVMAAVPYLQLKSAQGEAVEFDETLRHGWHYFRRVVGLYIVVGLAIIIGFLLLIVPGIIMVRRYFLSPYFLIDQDLTIRKAMQASAAATKGRAMAVWGIVGVDALVSLPAIIPIVGTIISAVLQLLYSCAPALRYEQIKRLPPAND